MDYLLGIDVGTTGIKAALFDTQGRLIYSITKDYPLITPHPNWVEQNPSDWWEKTQEALKDITENSKISANQIKAIGLSGQMHSSVFLDKKGEVVRPCILWCDQRTDKECQEIINRVGEEKLVSITGNTAMTGFTAPKVLWLRNNEPENYKQLDKLLMPKDYIRYKLTGKLSAEFSDASATILFNIKEKEWDEELLKVLDIDASILPDCCESIDICGKVKEEVAKVTGILSGTPIVAGGADNTCGAVGTGVVKEGVMMVSLGTSGIVFCPTANPKFDKGRRIHAFCHSVPGEWYLMGCMLSAGGAFRWFRDVLGIKEKEIAKNKGIDPYEILIESIKEISVGSEGLFFLPYLTGERSPHNDPYAKGVYIGLTLRHNKKHMIRALLEGVSFGLRDSLEVVKELGQEIKEVRITGGGARSPIWRQILSDIFNLPLKTITSAEGPAQGAAIMAGVGVGIYESIEKACDKIIKIKETTNPIKENVEKYEKFYKIYRKLYKSLKKDFRSIDGMVSG
jgi:xylulokinase